MNLEEEAIVDSTLEIWLEKIQPWITEWIEISLYQSIFKLVRLDLVREYACLKKNLGKILEDSKGIIYMNLNGWIKDFK